MKKKKNRFFERDRGLVHVSTMFVKIFQNINRSTFKWKIMKKRPQFDIDLRRIDKSASLGKIIQALRRKLEKQFVKNKFTIVYPKRRQRQSSSSIKWGSSSGQCLHKSSATRARVRHSSGVTLFTFGALLAAFQPRLILPNYWLIVCFCLFVLEAYVPPPPPPPRSTEFAFCFTFIMFFHTNF